MPTASRVQDADYTLSDLELLGLVEEPPAGGAEYAPGGEEIKAPQGHQPRREEKPQGAEDSPVQPEREEEVAGDMAEFAPAFAIPGVGPKLRAICERERGYRDAFATVEEARGIREVFHNAAEARTAAAARQELERLDALVESRDPRAHAELIAGLRRLAPESVRSLAIAFARLLPALDAEAHRSVAQALASATAAGEGVPSRDVRDPQGSGPGPRPDLPAPIGTARVPAARAAGEFVEAVNADVQRELRAAVEQRVNEVMPEAPQGARQKIAGEIFRELDGTLRGDLELQEQVREAVRGALLPGPGMLESNQVWREPAVAVTQRSSADPGNGQRVAQLIVRRAKAALPSVAKRVVADWTETVLRSSHARRARQSEAASRVEVGSGGAPSPVPAVPRRVDYHRMSDEEILNME